MNNRTKIFLAAGAAGILLLAILGGLVWYQIGQPLYTPGNVRAETNLRGPLTPPAQSDEAGVWQVEADIQLHYFTAGQGRPVLVVHGGPGLPATQAWAGLDSLTHDYTFYYYDQRGAGESTRPVNNFASSNYYENLTTVDKALGLGAQVADIERIRQILGEEKLIIIGHSFGGFLAALYAAEFPEHVEALVLIAPADVLVMPQPDGGLFEAVRAKLPEDKQAEYDAYLKRYLDFQNIFQYSEVDLIALNEEFGNYYAAVAPVPDLPPGRPGGWMVQAMYFSMGQRHDYRPELAATTAPVLVLHGANDLQPESASRLYADSFPDARFEVIAGAAHFVFEDQPDTFGEVVGSFLAGRP